MTIQLFLMFIAVCAVPFNIIGLYFSIRQKDKLGLIVSLIGLICSVLLFFETL